MANAALQTFKAKEAELIRQRDEYQAALRQIEDRLQFLHDLQAEFAISVKEDVSSAAVEKKADRAVNGELVSPSKAIVAYIAAHPDAKRREIVAAVVGKIKTQSEKPEEMIGTMLYQLVGRGRLTREEGKYRVVNRAAR